jgi:hypothetical protein
MFVDNSSDTTCINKWVVGTNPHDGVTLIIVNGRHEAGKYISKLGSVAATCSLSDPEELQLLEKMNFGGVVWITLGLEFLQTTI